MSKRISIFSNSVLFHFAKHSSFFGIGFVEMEQSVTCSVCVGFFFVLFCFGNCPRQMGAFLCQKIKSFLIIAIFIIFSHNPKMFLAGA